MSKIQQTIEVITPEVAKVYLDKNLPNNRKINKGQVSYYARMMSEGQWVCDGTPISFDENGHLVNGQHRLSACVEAGVPFETAVNRNVPENSFFVMDKGYSRRSSQDLSIAGIPNSRSICAMVGRYIKMVKLEGKAHSIDYTNRAGGSFKLSTTDILNKYNEDVEYWQSLHSLTTQMYVRCRILPADEVSPIIAYLNKHKGYDLDYVLDFWYQLFYAERTELQIIHLMRDKLINDKMSAVKMTSKMRTQLLVKVWECYKKNMSPKLLRWQPAVEQEKFFE